MLSRAQAGFAPFPEGDGLATRLSGGWISLLSQKSSRMTLLGGKLRKEYERGRLLEKDAPPDPLALFGEWLGGAVQAGIREPNAMTLATATPNGLPSARVVLLKGFDAHGFTFFTNYLSRKGRELAANPHAALCFWWGPLERQVRVEGTVERLPPEESDAYYHSRPLGSRLGAHVSAQSSVIAGRAVLEERLAALEAQYAGQPPPRPDSWGGYLVVPTMIEFWQGGPHRLHDRLRYTRQPGGGWLLERLSP
jgi:pyridoxamine 5'-phosphate oxidase